MHEVLLSGLFLFEVVMSQLTGEQIEIFRQRGLNITDDGDFWIFIHNGLPAYEYDEIVTTHIYHTPIPKQPIFAPEPACLTKGTIGLAINGVSYASPYNEDGYNVFDNPEAFDTCNGRVMTSGQYHYHNVPVCLTNQTVANELLGVALDGFPIYGSLTAEKVLTSKDLDSCHGQFRDGLYEYRITADFPYILGCFKGVVGDRNGRSGMQNQVPPSSQSPGSNKGDSNGRQFPIDTDPVIPSDSGRSDDSQTDHNGRPVTGTGSEEDTNSDAQPVPDETPNIPNEGSPDEEENREDQEHTGRDSEDDNNPELSDQDTDQDSNTGASTPWGFCYAVCRDPVLGCPEDKLWNKQDEEVTEAQTTLKPKPVVKSNGLRLFASGCVYWGSSVILIKLMYFLF